jgi:hypothetical protein
MNKNLWTQVKERKIHKTQLNEQKQRTQKMSEVFSMQESNELKLMSKNWVKNSNEQYSLNWSQWMKYQWTKSQWMKNPYTKSQWTNI